MTSDAFQCCCQILVQYGSSCSVFEHGLCSVVAAIHLVVIWVFAVCTCIASSTGSPGQWRREQCLYCLPTRGLYLYSATRNHSHILNTLFSLHCAAIHLDARVYHTCTRISIRPHQGLMEIPSLTEGNPFPAPMSSDHPNLCHHLEHGTMPHGIACQPDSGSLCLAQ